MDTLENMNDVETFLKLSYQIPQFHATKMKLSHIIDVRGHSFNFFD